MTARCRRCHSRTLRDRDGGRWCPACGEVGEPLSWSQVERLRLEAGQRSGKLRTLRPVSQGEFEFEGNHAD